MTGEPERLAAERYVLLTTFRRDGSPVSTPVWVAKDEDALLVVTTKDTGKIKRLRHTARVELTPCDRRGRPRSDAITVAAQASIIDDPGAVGRLSDRFRAKYGIEYRVARLIRQITNRGGAARVIRLAVASDDQPPAPPG